ncbi:UDP-N-acetylmuramoyl-L-alanyl-D-glutamate--2,6-diaminopimelate ligase [Thalassotalea profundi]|uniref:UDP-N-acetylmuramoyl-L-alanyl-D-glutamate--2,6-diaminopimelate ligase n=1 Tax=Thalassotalea profundi TaxID=2036687 RepID=A0ABQ3J0T6_9GAMM|nr:UDP-N-acetylmuramoyl-L-alanyl-D-glutamate--2,6-diaminopimelate ligase [Thalassotalea profundi]GHE95179.1 UDP-N-acetylmuramoyl-L-alanyl-D-glutamate--2,6-diaminopimelate ligase [Thalassotalea profundi]
MPSVHPINTALMQFDIKLDSNIVLDTKSQIVNDSRHTQAGDVFCAVIGSQSDGRQFISQALTHNVALIIAECESEAEHGLFEPLITANGTSILKINFYQFNEHLFNFASQFYNNPQNKLQLIGITGTNGKTSISQLTAKLLTSVNKLCAVIGTNGAGVVDSLTEIENTTPGATELMAWLHKFSEQQVSHVAMEVSSHALAQKRVKAELFNISVFSNLSRDHLDYHGTMENYAKTKYQIFSLQADQIAIINGDDQQAKNWLNNWPTVQPVIIYGRSEVISQYQAYVQACDISHSKQGAHFTLKTHLGDIAINSPLLGDFNIDNLLAAIAVLLANSISLKDISAAVSTLMPITGRMEAYYQDNFPTTVVDYAHTPDALKNALQACRQHCQGQLWVVFGCGGDRDKGKRPLMGEIAQHWADHVVITNDNPRTEMPKNIVKDILAGCDKTDFITVELERQQAVKQTIQLAKPDDVVLLAGKGHENYIVMGKEKVAYDERAIVKQIYMSETVL